MTRSRLILVSAYTAIAVVAWSLGAGSAPVKLAAAQDATPATTPDAIACTVAPRDIASLLATPAAEPGLRDIRQTLPEGTPADEETTAEIAHTVRELEACANTGDLLRLLAMFTDAGLEQTGLGVGEQSRAELVALEGATPSPFPQGERAVFAGPWHLQVLPDGRVLAAVGWFGSEADTCIDPNRIAVLIFAKQGGRWLIDERIERVASGELIDLVGPPPAAVGPEACASETTIDSNDD